MEKIINKNGNDNASCPKCGHYNAMLFDSYENDFIDGNAIHKCRDCGYKAIVENVVCMCGHNSNEHYQGICEAPSCACNCITPFAKKEIQEMETIKEAALSAFRIQEVEQAKIAEQKLVEETKNNALIAQKTKEQFEAQFGIKLEASQVSIYHVIFENYRCWKTKDEFFNTPPQWRIIKNCSNMTEDYDHQEVAQGWFTDLEGLGSFINANDSRKLCWNCEIAERPSNHIPLLTTEQQLLNLLKQFIAENSYQGEI